MSIMHSAQAKSIGGRDGRIESDNKVLNLELTMPRTLGGRNREGATNPEQLFAAGYAACFGNAVIHTARQAKANVGEIVINAEVDLFMDAQQLPTLVVRLYAHLPGATQEQAEDIVAKAHQACPYSRAIRGNAEVTITVTSDAGASSQD
ncbi:Ohr subfamily peroxiredoxin [Hymenobacter luteus]|uniref:Ohr subfamily peroxiredoxin n=2 Tax=Hymenobacter TaxID=89966 RepID=A0A7W9WCW7_9BACT|nr:MULTISPECIES: Ohr family peroxiredoxin [Hymenobacter]MBB4603611.1 Ohr subfamily peroxiredoxin [Hymenobacter latericoloratus]MBB6061359.1 Ohr subfamily peroxiredoxin [Hymenobacter luteus]